MKCQSFGSSSHLASFLSSKESEIVAGNILDEYPTMKDAWIGLHDAKKTRRWRWTDSSTTNFRPWNRGEPNNQGGEEFCVYLSASAGFQKWNDGDCRTEMSYICKFSL
ncbi:C-type lectin-like [Hemicordylus capensis]|uniref:C-type lectin-like n=1 Tax=Hemicordylus capensis TaxID=884348 RepID=UPI002303CFE6|nr:C-type lectin-like [Hemicordylus capensis]